MRGRVTLSERNQQETAALLSRAAAVRPLIRDGEIDPWTALSYVLWPTVAILEAEERSDLVRRWAVAEGRAARRGTEAA